MKKPSMIKMEAVNRLDETLTEMDYFIQSIMKSGVYLTERIKKCETDAQYRNLKKLTDETLKLIMKMEDIWSAK